MAKYRKAWWQFWREPEPWWFDWPPPVPYQSWDEVPEPAGLWWREDFRDTWPPSWTDDESVSTDEPEWSALDPAPSIPADKAKPPNGQPGSDETP